MSPGILCTALRLVSDRTQEALCQRCAAPGALHLPRCPFPARERERGRGRPRTRQAASKRPRTPPNRRASILRLPSLQQWPLFCNFRRRRARALHTARHSTPLRRHLRPQAAARECTLCLCRVGPLPRQSPLPTPSLHYRPHTTDHRSLCGLHCAFEGSVIPRLPLRRTSRPCRRSCTARAIPCRCRCSLQGGARAPSAGPPRPPRVRRRCGTRTRTPLQHAPTQAPLPQQRSR
mmetsp:Transcript_19626/g.75327  ORF Transcript_19626/g.75327 Transcript_19626/m.75327 type:complete len:234 (+) Transcript_19626:388-1089(+)